MQHRKPRPALIAVYLGILASHCGGRPCYLTDKGDRQLAVLPLPALLTYCPP